MPQQSYDLEQMSANAKAKRQHADTMLNSFNQVKTQHDQMVSTGAWKDPSADKLSQQIQEMIKPMTALHSAIHNHADVQEKQQANAAQLGTDIH